MILEFGIGDSLEVGKQANLVMLSNNLMTVPVTQIKNTEVLGSLDA